MCSHMLGEVLAEIARSTCRTNFARQYCHLVLNALPYWQPVELV